MKRLSAVAVLMTVVACNFNPDAQSRVDAAKGLARNYPESEIKAYAAGTDCLVLLIRTHASLDDAAVETMHYGTGESATHPGGLQQFAEDREFRAVAYRDARGELWTYGAITRAEAQSMPICR